MTSMSTVTPQRGPRRRRQPGHPRCSPPTARSATPRPPGFGGVDTFTYRASDGTLDSNLATVTITVAAVDDAPVCLDGSRTTAEDTVLDGSVGCTDGDSASLTYALATDVAHGSLALDPDGSFHYTPSADFPGTDGFTFTAADATTTSPAATITITVTPINDAPTPSTTLSPPTRTRPWRSPSRAR